MTARPHPGLTLAVAAALAGATPLTAPASADEPLVEHCYTTALTDEQVADGEVSEVDCYWASPDDPPMQRRGGGITYAVVYDTTQYGSFLFVNSPAGATTCTGGSTVFSAGHPWDNRISSTELWACGAAKHHQWSNFTGNNQLVLGAGYTTMSSTMNNATSSITYAP